MISARLPRPRNFDIDAERGALYFAAICGRRGRDRSAVRRACVAGGGGGIGQK